MMLEDKIVTVITPGFLSVVFIIVGLIIQNNMLVFSGIVLMAATLAMLVSIGLIYLLAKLLVRI